MAFLTNLASSLLHNTLPEVATKLFPAAGPVIEQFKTSKTNIDSLYKNISGDVRKSFTAFEVANPVFKKLSTQLKNGEFGLDEKLDNKMSGYDDMMGDMGDLTEMNFDDMGGGESGGDTSMPDGVAASSQGISEGEGLIAGQLNYQNTINKRVNTMQLGILSEMSKNMALMAAFQAEQTTAHYDQASEYYRMSASFQSDFTTKFDTIFKHFDDVEQRKKNASKQREDEDPLAIFDPTKALKPMWESISMLFGENGMISQSITRIVNDPLGFMLSKGIEGGVKKFFGKDIDSVNSFLDAMPFKLNNILTEWANDTDKGFLSTIKKFFGDTFSIAIDPNKKIKTTKFEKDDLEGKSKHSIINVIPMYLSKILKAITKSDSHEVYSYEQGKFTTDKDLLKSHKVNLVNAQKNKLGSLKGGLDEFTGKYNIRGDDSKVLETTIRQINKKQANPNLADISQIDIPSNLPLQEKIRQIGKTKAGRKIMNDLIYNNMIKERSEIQGNNTRIQNDFRGSDEETAVMMQNDSSRMNKKSNQFNHFTPDATVSAKLKDAVSFNDITRTSIITVIPGYLAKILKVLSSTNNPNADVEIFDHKKGKFISGTSAKKTLEDKSKEAYSKSRGVGSSNAGSMRGFGSYNTQTGSTLDDDIFNFNDAESKQDDIKSSKEYLFKYYDQFKNTIKEFKNWDINAKMSLFNMGTVKRNLKDLMRKNPASVKSYDKLLFELLPHTKYIGTDSNKSSYVLSPDGNTDLEAALNTLKNKPSSFQEKVFKLLPSDVMTKRLSSMKDWSEGVRNKFLSENYDTFIRYRREGGMVHGPGTGTSDSIPVMASNGEMVVNAESTKHFKPLLKFINDKKNGAVGKGAKALRGIVESLVGKDEEGNVKKFNIDNIKAGLEAKIDEATEKYLIKPMEKIFEKSKDFLTKKVFSPMGNSMKKYLINKSSMKGSINPDDFTMMDSATLLFNEKIMLPLKSKILGKNMSDEEKDKVMERNGLFGVMKKSFTVNVMNPFKKKLLGDKAEGMQRKELENTSLFSALGTKFEKLTDQFKFRIIGNTNDELTNDEVKNKNILSLIGLRINESILTPFKRKLLGDKAEGMSIKQLNDSSILSAVGSRLDKTIMTPFKKLLLGDKAEGMTDKELSEKSFVSTLEDTTHKLIITPFKRMLLGKAGSEALSDKTVEEMSVFKMIKEKSSDALYDFKLSLVPMKSALTAEDVKNMSLYGVVKDRIQLNVIDPFKKMLVGEEKVKEGITLYKAIMTKVDTMFKPLTQWLFGSKEEAKIGIFKKITNGTSDFFNKLLFGFSKAEKGGLWSNMKDSAMAGLKWFDEKYIKFTLNNLDKHILPLLKDILVEGSGLLVDKLKGLTLEFKDTLGQLFSKLMNNNSIKLLRNYIVKPIQDGLTSLGKTFTNVFQKLTGGFLIKTLESVSDRIKKQRVGMGKGDRYSELELERLAKGGSRLDKDYLARSEELGTKKEKKFAKAMKSELGTDPNEEVVARYTTETANNTESINKHIEDIKDKLFGNTAKKREEQEKAQAELDALNETKRKENEAKLAAKLKTRDDMAAAREKQNVVNEENRKRKAKLSDNEEGGWLAGLSDKNKAKVDKVKSGIGGFLKGALKLLNPLTWVAMSLTATKMFSGLLIKGLMKTFTLSGKLFSKSIETVGGSLLKGLTFLGGQIAKTTIGSKAMAVAEAVNPFDTVVGNIGDKMNESIAARYAKHLEKKNAINLANDPEAVAASLAAKKAELDGIKKLSGGEQYAAREKYELELKAKREAELKAHEEEVNKPRLTEDEKIEKIIALKAKKQAMEEEKQARLKAHEEEMIKSREERKAKAAEELKARQQAVQEEKEARLVKQKQELKERDDLNDEGRENILNARRLALEEEYAAKLKAVTNTPEEADEEADEEESLTDKLKAKLEEEYAAKMEAATTEHNESFVEATPEEKQAAIAKRKAELEEEHKQEMERKKAELANQRELTEEEKATKLKEHEEELKKKAAGSHEANDAELASGIAADEEEAKKKADNRTKRQKMTDKLKGGAAKGIKMGGAALALGGGATAVAGMIGGEDAANAVATVSSYASTGAMIGALLPIPGGTLIGGLLGGGIGLVKALGGDGGDEAMDSISETVDGVLTGIEDFVNTFPDKLTDFLSGIPEAIMSLIGPDNDAEVKLDAEGNPVEKKASLLGGIFGVFGKIAISLGKLALKLPILVSDMIRTAAISLVGSLVGGIGSGILQLGKGIEWSLAAAKGLIPEPFGPSDEQEAAEKAAIVAKYAKYNSDWIATVKGGIDASTAVSKGMTSAVTSRIDSGAAAVGGALGIPPVKAKAEEEAKEETKKAEEAKEIKKTEEEKSKNKAEEKAKEETKKAEEAKEIKKTEEEKVKNKAEEKAKEETKKAEEAKVARVNANKASTGMPITTQLKSSPNTDIPKAPSPTDLYVGNISPTGVYQAPKGSLQRTSASAEAGFFNKLSGLFGYDSAGSQQVAGEGLQLANTVGRATTGKNESVDDAIAKAAMYAKQGGGMPILDVNLLSALATIESSYGKAIKPSKKYKGLFQMGPEASRQVGVPYTDDYLLNNTNNAMAAVDFMHYNAKQMAGKKIPLTPATLYLSHQQGLGGLNAIYKAATTGGTVSNDILHNMFNNVDSANLPFVQTPGEFLTYWEARLAKGGNSIKPADFLKYKQDKAGGKINMYTPGKLDLTKMNQASGIPGNLPTGSANVGIPTDVKSQTVAVSRNNTDVKGTQAAQDNNTAAATTAVTKAVATKEAINTTKVEATLNDANMVNAIKETNASLKTLIKVTSEAGDKTAGSFFNTASAINTSNANFLNVDKKVNTLNKTVAANEHEKSKMLVMPTSAAEQLVASKG